jgi:hypothetical protein
MDGTTPKGDSMNHRELFTHPTEDPFEGQWIAEQARRKVESTSGSPDDDAMLQAFLDNQTHTEYRATLEAWLSAGR